jgi:ribonuclease HII
MADSKKPNFELELQFAKNDFIIAGVDEVGRGSIAGPIVAAAVVFENYPRIEILLGGIDDSKKLSVKKRDELDKLIRSKATDYAIGLATVEEIDLLGIGSANILAFERALKGLKKCDLALIDGRKFRGFTFRYICLEKGESKSISIAAASIIAKVYRDALMKDLSTKLNFYDFDRNKGYGSKKHYDDIRTHGLSKYHRKSFLKFCFDKQKNLF